ncbi:MAG: hypothetical protein J6Q92_05180 [Oscillospiraceae bacterium]|nr:hypothetical protein [Oscillospiraceae bacterium]
MAYSFPYYGQQPFQYQDQLNQLRNSPVAMPAMYPTPMPTRPEPSGLNWVQGEAGAKSWIVTPGSTVLLMDSEMMRFYLKSADPNGVPSLRTFEYAEVGAVKPTEAVPAAQFVPINVFEDFKKEVMGKLDELAQPVVVSRAKKGGNADE